MLQLYLLILFSPYSPLVIREKPLVIYVFSNSNKLVKEFRTNTSSGGFCSNETIMHCGGIFAIMYIFLVKRYLHPIDFCVMHLYYWFFKNKFLK